MSEETKGKDNKDKPQMDEEKKLKLIAMINAGIDPSISDGDKEKTTQQAIKAYREIEEKDKIFTQENFDKLIKGYEDLSQHTIKKDVEANRKVLLDEIKELNEDSYKEEKENYSLNELQATLRALKKTKPSTNKRDVGASDGEEKSEGPNTQYSHVKNKFVPG